MDSSAPPLPSCRQPRRRLNLVPAGRRPLFRRIDSVQSDFHLPAIAEYLDGVTIGNGNYLGWPGQARGRQGEEEKKDGEAGTTHAGLP